MRSLGPTLGLAALALVVPPAVHPLVSAPARAFEVVAPQVERSISLVVGTGQLIRVDEDFTSLFVANPDVADIQVKSPRLLYLTGVGVGETTLFALDEGDTVLMSSKIRVTHNTDALQEGLARVAPGQGLRATSVDRSLVLTGTVATPEQAADAALVASQFVDDPSQVVNRLEVASPTQVNLQVRIAEVRRNIDRQFGISWDSNNFTSPVAGAANAFNLAINRIGGLNLNVVLQALAAEGLVSILAEPNLTARSGEPASFLAGGEFPYPVAQRDGVVTFEFRDYGVGLTFTPTVLDADRISLKVNTEVSELDFTVAQTTNFPGIITRRAETTVDIASGQSFAIAGLIQNSSATNIRRLPGLSSLPILGTLFRSSEFQRGQTELVVIVTPVLVKPTNARNLRTPVDNYTPPNDFERILQGRVQGDPARTSRVQQSIGQRRLHGAAGFVFE